MMKINRKKSISLGNNKINRFSCLLY